MTVWCLFMFPSDSRWDQRAGHPHLSASWCRFGRRRRVQGADACIEGQRSHFSSLLWGLQGWRLTECVCAQASIPFAVIGSNQLIEVKGKKIRGRLYPWGVVEVENPEHNDFLKLRTMLVWVYYGKLHKDATVTSLYELFTLWWPNIQYLYVK